MNGQLDEAFMGLAGMIEELVAFRAPIRDPDGRLETRITAYEVETPIELDMVVDDVGLRLGSVPPLYHVDVSVEPVLHRIRFRAELDDAERDGGQEVDA